MGNKIKKGDIVEIIAIHEDSAWYDNQRRKLIGKKVKLERIETIDELESCWKFIAFCPKEFEYLVYIRGAKVRRVKK